MTRFELATFTLLALAACAPQPTISPDFGASVRHNMAAQIINPEPRPAEAPPGQDGARAQSAIERYRAGKVTKPASMSTSDNLITIAPSR